MAHLTIMLDIINCIHNMFTKSKLLPSCIVCMYFCIASGVPISIATNSVCNYNDSLLNSVVVYNSSVNLTCCVEEFPCPGLTISWYRNGSDEEISRDKVLHVNLTEPEETFICVADNVIPYPNCYEKQYNATVTLIQGI